MRRLAVLAALVMSAPAGAQTPTLSAAIASGQVGERYDGYMGLAAPAPEDVRRQVNAINIRRRNLYIELGSRRNVTAQVVGLETACQLFARLPVGGAYMAGDGSWRRRMPGQPAPVPDYCKR
jgi:uncharacterized protein YdbL (DUF1318 family)